MVTARRTAVTITTIRRCVILGAVAIVLAACSSEHHTAAPAAASPASSSPASQGSKSAATATIYLPTQLLGHNENTSTGAKQLISIFDKNLISPLTAAMGGHWTSAVYGGGDVQSASTPTTDFFIVVAGTLQKPISSPDNFVRQLQDSLLAKGITDVKLLPADANGVARACGEEQGFIICSWADHISVGYVVYSAGVASDLSDGASKTSQIRSAVVR
jgi:hypothetical protein